MRATRGFVVALLGAESTGKTTLAAALRDACTTAGLAPSADRIAVVPEYLREFCDRHERTPRVDEQGRIAAEQTARIDAAAACHELVIADTSALMTAVYSEIVFGDRTLYRAAEAAHAHIDLVLLTALDLPWRADGLQRDGPQVREPVDQRVRAGLDRIGRPYAVVHGRGPARVGAALAGLRRAWTDYARAERPAEAPGCYTPVARCERCGDPGCERRMLLPRL